MPIQYASRPERFRGTGTAFIAWEPDEAAYVGYWDRLPDGPPAPLKPMPRTDSLEVAVEWGRERAARVLLRPASHPDEYFWAGRGDPRYDDAVLPRLVVWRHMRTLWHAKMPAPGRSIAARSGRAGR
jgi:hypothetical protein